jgi:hypothetical protein
MIFRQYLDIKPVAASYLFGCGGKGVATGGPESLLKRCRAFWHGD